LLKMLVLKKYDCQTQIKTVCAKNLLGYVWQSMLFSFLDIWFLDFLDANPFPRMYIWREKER
jgi:hypothetical protein